MTDDHVHDVALSVTTDPDGKRQYQADGPCLTCGAVVEQAPPDVTRKWADDLYREMMRDVQPHG